MKLEASTQQEIFRMIRAKKNLTLEEVAQNVGVTRQMVNQYEKDGITNLKRTSRAYLPLCKIYEVDPETLGKIIDKQMENEKARGGNE